jgi:hypothetical protein
MPIITSIGEFRREDDGQQCWQFTVSKEGEAFLRHVIDENFGLLARPAIERSDGTGNLLVTLLQSDPLKGKFERLVTASDGFFHVAVLEHNTKERLREFPQ